MRAVALLLASAVLFGCPPRYADDDEGRDLGADVAADSTSDSAQPDMIPADAADVADVADASMTGGCGSLEPAECEATPGCRVVEGRLHNESKGCFGGWVAVGCGTRHGCSNQVSFLRNARGECYAFSTIDCVPEGGNWEEAGEGCADDNSGDFMLCD